MPLRGWKRLGGTSERYLNPEGQIVSRRQYDNARAEAAGWPSRSAYERRYKDPSYLWAFRQYQRNQKLTVTQARRLDRMGQPLSKELRAAQATNWGQSKEGRNPKGPMAKLLVDMGLRDPFATYAVGNTDAGRRE